jgi:calcineurin-like phosphoesterase family protein
MPRAFFTSDHRFGRRAIIGEWMHAPRRFLSIEAHDETLVSRWNAVVLPEDTVWHLGDFAYRCSAAYARAIFERLNRRKLLIRGNHDRIGARMASVEPVRDVARIEVLDEASGPVRMWLRHCAHVVWPNSFRSAIHLYGHSHGSLPGTAAGLMSVSTAGIGCRSPWTGSMSV